jgi:uncharacterized protein
MEMSPAHRAVEIGDVAALRELLDAGADVEDRGPDGLTLLFHAIDVESDSAAQAGDPLHVDMTALLLARGADLALGHPHQPDAAMLAESCGHWLAAELIRAFMSRSAKA